MRRTGGGRRDRRWAAGVHHRLAVRMETDGRLSPVPPGLHREGKGNGKSPLAGGIGLTMLTADGEAGAEIYAAGATKDQAGILFRDAVKMRDGSRRTCEAAEAERRRQGREYNLAYLRNGLVLSPDQPGSEKDRIRPAPAHGAVRRGSRAPRPRRHGDAGARVQVPPPAAAVDDHEQRFGSQFGLLGGTRTRGQGGGRQPRRPRR
jgi:hypothetical protein